MLALQPNCEHCGKNLAPNSAEAMICSFECTYCQQCALDLFENVCPSCGGNFVPRPIRPVDMLQKYPASEKPVYKPKKSEQFKAMTKRYKNIPSTER